ncbi:hypothetical protein AVEN_176812-1 [Araneus ventricosus]|uniref:MBD domain-containing protein n=1 Tax=Araneus ventricosus TaxID=182803 RepID=A0A4Y2MQU2_ARAVE|nr:hypothetical protein AVEN_176812-1 [Araneus ventricosus]
MNMPAESSPFAFPKLDGSNYTSCKEDMKVMLMDRGCWSFIIEDKPCPEHATEKEKFEYEWRKQRCYITIYQGIERKFLPLIRHTTDGKEAWNILKTNFEPTSKARLAVLIDEFFELKFNPEEESIGIFCKRVYEKKTQVKEAGFEISELLIALHLIRRLPAEYDHLVQTPYRLKDEEFNHREVEKQLVNEAGRIQLKQKDLNLDYTENAYTVGSFRLQETRKKSSERSGAVLDPSRNPVQYRKINYPKRMGPFCDFCSRKGHNASKCYKKRNKEKKEVFASETSFCGTNQAFGISTDWDQFLIDTAATSHFCYERDWFKNFKKLTTTKALLADKKSTCEVEGKCDIDFIVKDIKVNRNKLQPKGKIGILVGYAVNRRGYRVWLPKERKVVESIHVKIDETKNGVKTLFGKVKHYDYAIYQLDQILNNDSDYRAQDGKSSSPKKPSSLDISTWIRLEKPRKKSKRIDVHYYPPSKERLRSINDVKIYCQRNKLEFDLNQFNFNPTKTNTRFAEKCECDNETSSDSIDEASLVNDIFQHQIYMTEIPKTF